LITRFFQLKFIVFYNLLLSGHRVNKGLRMIRRRWTQGTDLATKRGLLGARKDCDDIGIILEEAAAEWVLEDTKAQDSDDPPPGTPTTSSSE
jgi:hypothetical protein